jgi:hypothetical protein
MAELLPTPKNEGNNDANSDQRRGGHRRQRKQIPIPTVDQILQMLLQLNSAVTIGLISTKEASIINRNLQTILAVQMKREGRSEDGPGYEALVELCRRDPRVINVLEPFLTDDVFESLMQEVAKARDGSA